MSKHAEHIALFHEALRDFARLHGVNRAFARGTGLYLMKTRSADALNELDRIAAESARTAPLPGSEKTPEQHAVEQARLQPASVFWMTSCMNGRPSDLQADDEWHTLEAVRAMVTHTDALERINGRAWSDGAAA